MSKDRKKCPNCDGVLTDITPLKKKDERISVWACQACGNSFKADGGAFVKDAAALRDVFKGATGAKRTVVEAMKGENMTPATKNLLTALVLEYGLQMWMDGVKQGILLGTIREEAKKNDKGDIPISG